MHVAKCTHCGSGPVIEEAGGSRGRTRVICCGCYRRTTYRLLPSTAWAAWNTGDLEKWTAYEVRQAHAQAKRLSRAFNL